MYDGKIEFEWNEAKANINLDKHRVSFMEAMTVWDDEFAVLVYDPNHSIEEHRYIMIGYSIKNNLLFVSFTETNDKIRLISARKATKSERRKHEEFKSRL